MNKRNQNGRRKTGIGVTGLGGAVENEAERLFLSVIPPVGAKTILAAQEVMTQPLQRIAEDFGKPENEVTPYDVMIFTYTRLPQAVGKAMFYATLEQFETWQSMVQTLSQRVPFTLNNR